MSGLLTVVIATAGRPAIVARLVASLTRDQTRPPDRVFVVGASEADIAQIAPHPCVTAFVGRRGSCPQRNDALDAGAAQGDVVVFFDDDFAPSRFWLERVEAVFASAPDVAGVTGTVLADGAKTAGVDPLDAWATVAARDREQPDAAGFEPRAAPYGCNMAVRGARARDQRFDERLPSYGWLEDRDYAERVCAGAPFGRSARLWGVHMGTKSGRTSGVRLGYSQIANAVYLVRKGTATPLFAFDLAGRNILANLMRSLRPEPWIDRRGRLKGNCLALADLVRGQVTPERAGRL